jgi:hypothetical protein
MTRPGHNFPPADELPIPSNVQPDSSWTRRMLEMAVHIGPYATLLLVERFGGMRIYIPADWSRGKVYEDKGSIRDVVGDKTAKILSDIYTREYFHFPTARLALATARRAPVIASVRSGDITGAKAARLLGTSRPYLSHLVNKTEEGTDVEAAAWTGPRDPSQLDMFGDVPDA